MRIARNYKQMSTHIPTLLLAVQSTAGSVCEVGCGFSSTALLHWLCLGRILVTYESDPDYFKFAKHFQTNTHRIRAIEDIEFDRHWSVVLIDHACKKPYTRGDDALKFINADLIVLHDTEPENQENYGYDKVFPHFKYRYDWKECKPFTSVVSNVVDVTQW